jgi:hypothetical protein
LAGLIGGDVLAEAYGAGDGLVKAAEGDHEASHGGGVAAGDGCEKGLITLAQQGGHSCGHLVFATQPG